jgi:hypothetical protein
MASTIEVFRVVYNQMELTSILVVVAVVVSGT